MSGAPAAAHAAVPGDAVVDVHGHVYPPGYVAVVREAARGAGPHAEVARAFLDHPLVTTEPAFLGAYDRRLALMDAARIDVQLLGFASMNVWHPDPVTRSRLVRAFNDGCAEVVAAHPDRFRFLASLPLPHVEAAVEEARRARDLTGFAGYCIPTHIDTAAIDLPRWDPVWGALAETGSLVLLHPDGFCARGALTDHGMEWSVGAPFEDTVVAVRLVAGGVIERFPAITWVVPHLGGTLPFLLHRLRWRWELEARRMGASLPRAELLDRLLFDTANSSPETLRLAAQVLPPGRLVLGTDYPFVGSDDLAPSVDLVRRAVTEGLVDPGALGGLLAAVLPTLWSSP
ncbi:amidohydrolase family protein [Aquipuribacter nitratireducens]|uniref:Amidohydrolase family protein n=1 Tax=Aquipuribacter nitratireducens TaxID=650104 RepID=A0ABW0GMS7_9MICO